MSSADRVADAFIQGRYDRAGEFVGMGDALYSYAFQIAQRLDDGSIILDQNVSGYLAKHPGYSMPSRTTAKHVSAFGRALERM